MDCRLSSDSWDGELVLPATDISNEGVWVETPCMLARGEEIVVSFALPNAPAEPVWAIAEVARVGMWRRREDPYPPGMGLVFTYCSEEDRRRLSSLLRGRPPRLPPARKPPPLPARSGARFGGHDVGAPPATPPRELPAVLEDPSSADG